MKKVENYEFLVCEKWIFEYLRKMKLGNENRDMRNVIWRLDILNISIIRDLQVMEQFLEDLIEEIEMTHFRSKFDKIDEIREVCIKVMIWSGE